MSEIHVVSIDAKVQRIGFTSLVALCKAHNLDYNSVTKGKRVWVKGDTLTVITSVLVQKIKGRENNFKSKGI